MWRLVLLFVHVSTVEKILDPLLDVLCDNGSDGVVCGCGVCCHIWRLGGNGIGVEWTALGLYHLLGVGSSARGE